MRVISNTGTRHGRRILNEDLRARDRSGPEAVGFPDAGRPERCHFRAAEWTTACLFERVECMYEGRVELQRMGEITEWLAHLVDRAPERFERLAREKCATAPRPSWAILPIPMPGRPGAEPEKLASGARHLVCQA